MKFKHLHKALKFSEQYSEQFTTSCPIQRQQNTSKSGVEVAYFAFNYDECR